MLMFKGVRKIKRKMKMTMCIFCTKMFLFANDIIFRNTDDVARSVTMTNCSTDNF